MNNNYLRPSELYQRTLNNLHTFPDEAQDSILENLKHLKWVSEMLTKLSPYQREIFKLYMINQLNDETAPFCLMSMTCIVNYLKKYGIDVSCLENQINNSKRVKSSLHNILLQNQVLHLLTFN